MTTPTTDLRTMLDQATPGPWGHYTPDGRQHFDPVFGATPGDEVAKVLRPADWRLIAAAPELAAEVIRLRKMREGIEAITERLSAGLRIPAATCCEDSTDEALTDVCTDLRALLGDQS